MDPLLAGAISAFAVAVVTTVGNVFVGRMNTRREKAKSAEDAAAQVVQKEHEVHEERIAFKDEQIAHWRSRYESCVEERDRDR